MKKMDKKPAAKKAAAKKGAAPAAKGKLPMAFLAKAKGKKGCK